MDCSLSDSSVHRILQERILEWVVMPSSGDFPNPGIELSSLMSLALADRFFFTTRATWQALFNITTCYRLVSPIGWWVWQYNSQRLNKYLRFVMNFQNCWLFLLYRQHKLSLMEEKKSLMGLNLNLSKEKKDLNGAVCVKSLAKSRHFSLSFCQFFSWTTFRIHFFPSWFLTPTIIHSLITLKAS